MSYQDSEFNFKTFQPKHEKCIKQSLFESMFKMKEEHCSLHYYCLKNMCYDFPCSYNKFTNYV